MLVLGVAASAGLRSAGALASTVRGFGDEPPSDDPTVVLFAVPMGASAMAIGKDLEQAGLVRSAVAFRLQAELRRAGGRLVEGQFELRRNMTMAEILDVLTSGQSRPTLLVTIPEGWRAEETALHLEGNGVVSAQAFMDAVAGGIGAEGLTLPSGAQSFEGYLFPDTYDFGRDPTPSSVLRTLVDQFEKRVGREVRDQAQGRGFSLHEVVTLASIIEREAVRPEERVIISAAFHNRLARGMPLQADPTTQYALVPFGTLAPSGSFWKTRLEIQDLQMPSPFNTYQAAGLPPGPIANPGIASIEAAATPAGHDWLYFVARADGSHLFARTLDEHLVNIARVRREEPNRGS